jgi:DNA-binding IclR family transcriptional regulator
VKNKPAYSIDSVDHALRLAVLLQQEGPFGVAEVAERIGVARSTAHRLLAMLVYRDFAEQGADRRYRVGPVLQRVITPDPAAVLRDLALPHLRDLVERTGETANIMIRAGDQVRFVATVECTAVLRVGDREGRMLPIHLTSGGRALLAWLPEPELAATLPAAPPQESERLLRDMRRVRRVGYALNEQLTETGVTAVGSPVRGSDGIPMAAISVAMPTARYTRARLPQLAADLHVACTRLESDLAAAGSTQS